MAKTAKERKADERARKRQDGLVPVQEWVHREDADSLRGYAARLRKDRAAGNDALTWTGPRSGVASG